MDVEQLRAEMESNHALRQDEILQFQNQVELAPSGRDKDRLRRALVLLLYAHYEGFVKFALSVYVNAINASRFRCSEVNSALAAASMGAVFHGLRNPQPVSGLFRGQVPDDSQLIKFAREREFVERAYELLDIVVELPDAVIDAEWNLKPPVLRKLLYRLGLDPEALASEDGRISQLVNRRNAIAHGADIAGVSEQVYVDLRTSTFLVMSTIARTISESVERRSYLKPT
jgi:hypothetical protein